MPQLETSLDDVPTQVYVPPAGNGPPSPAQDSPRRIDPQRLAQRHQAASQATFHQRPDGNIEVRRPATQLDRGRNEVVNSMGQLHEPDFYFARFGGQTERLPQRAINTGGLHPGATPFAFVVARQPPGIIDGIERMDAGYVRMDEVPMLRENLATRTHSRPLPDYFDSRFSTHLSAKAKDKTAASPKASRDAVVVAGDGGEAANRDANLAQR